MERNHEENESEETYSLDNEYFFNQNGFISEQRQYSSEDLVRVYTYIYDDKNLLTSKICFNQAGELMTKSKYENELNKKGKLIKQSEFISIGNFSNDSINIKYNPIPNYITKYFYDSDWNLIKYEVYDKSLSASKEVLELIDKTIIKSSYIMIKDNEIFNESSYSCLDYDLKKNCIRYKKKDGDSIETYLNSTIEYFE